MESFIFIKKYRYIFYSSCLLCCFDFIEDLGFDRMWFKLLWADSFQNHSETIN